MVGSTTPPFNPSKICMFRKGVCLYISSGIMQSEINSKVERELPGAYAFSLHRQGAKAKATRITVEINFLESSEDGAF